MRLTARDARRNPESGIRAIAGSSPEALAARAAGILRELEEQFGISVPRGSRYHRYLIELRRAAESPEPTDETRRDVWHRAMIELYDLETAIRVLAEPPAVVGWDRLIKETFSGGVRRKDEVQHSRARDIQFELAVGSLLRQAGFHVEFAEPDVLARRGARQFAFAVKRPRSRTKIIANIKKADEQMRRAAKSGLIAIDITSVASPADRTFATKDRHNTFELLANVAANFGSRNAASIHQMVDTTSTYGLLVHVALPVADLNDGTLGYIRRWSVTSLVGDHDPRTRTLKGLAQRFSDVIGRLTSR